MVMTITSIDQPILAEDLSLLLRTLCVEPLSSDKDIANAQALLKAHHYLGELNPVGERIFYKVSDSEDNWYGVLVFLAAARRVVPTSQTATTRTSGVFTKCGRCDPYIILPLPIILVDNLSGIGCLDQSRQTVH